MMYKHPILTKVPGDTSRGSAKEKQGYIHDITKLSKTELLDLKERQELLLKNKARISKLPDKGARIEKFYKLILQQLDSHENIERAAEMFSELNIAAVGKSSMAKMEWNGKYNARHGATEDIVDSDDEFDDQNVDPLKVLAQSTHHQKRIIVTKPEPSLVTKQDLADIEQMKQERLESAATDVVEIDIKKSANKMNSFLKQKQPVQQKETGNGTLLDGHSILLCRKESSMEPKEKFLPHRTTKSNVHDPEKEKLRFLGHLQNWENTSATPPAIAHSPAKVLSLEESIKLQEEKNILLQKAQEQYAEERLQRRQKIKATVRSTITNDVMPGSSQFTTYRDVWESEEESNEDDDEGNGDFTLDTEDN
ncbi:uncharacterized protein LOC134227022 [Armigeres subalbatus]|uniref:uncharacterized protein LOC134227022 n=1 Tax=Armigeres subalbatus TaxID=124917 RepID=UPI002ED28A2B